MLGGSLAFNEEIREEARKRKERALSWGGGGGS